MDFYPFPRAFPTLSGPCLRSPASVAGTGQALRGMEPVERPTAAHAALSSRLAPLRAQACWDVFVAFFIVYSVVEVTFRLGFDAPAEGR